MAGKELDLKKGDILPDEDLVYRIVLSTERDRKNKMIPAARCFDLSPQDNNKLSVDWNAKTSPEECIARVGGSFRFEREEYKPYHNREIYAMEIAFLNRLDDVLQLEYDPIIHNPPQKGNPNNPAHSLVVFHLSFLNDKAKRPETILKIRNHAKHNRISLNNEKLDDLVKSYRVL